MNNILFLYARDHLSLVVGRLCYFSAPDCVVWLQRVWLCVHDQDANVSRVAGGRGWVPGAGQTVLLQHIRRQVHHEGLQVPQGRPSGARRATWGQLLLLLALWPLFNICAGLVLCLILDYNFIFSLLKSLDSWALISSVLSIQLKYLEYPFEVLWLLVWSYLWSIILAVISD